ncbi:DJ-1/PfpI family protein [Alicyclobacillus dauci]|uniref:DJ-1/PfpI family protein n=1 Tax=Alicyclobacillus dauci TaxID=1475485 RepID=A0ABY6YZ10_9BACL|nr:DJ-1/PfpI family protein [Alicyclobacillus dauci]WAH35854.1 DJ-1/PfpI family protein [Alicyclobacillus dauci]
MYKAALIALPFCSFGDLSELLQQLNHRGFRLRVLSLDGHPVTTAEGIRVLADTSLQDTVPWDLQLIVIPGGQYASEVWGDIRLHRFLRQYDGHRGWIATSKEGVICLAGAGLLGGTRYSAPAHVVKTFGHLLRHAIHTIEPVTVDANVISSDGTQSATFSKMVFERLDLTQ